MIPVMQTSFVDREKGTRGNCLAACLASILEIPITDVPDLTGPEFAPESPTRHAWYEIIQGWLRERHSCVMVDLRARHTDQSDRVEPVIFPYYMGAGPSTRGDWRHGVVMEGGRVVHDPHPARDFTTAMVDEITILFKVAGSHT